MLDAARYQKRLAVYTAEDLERERDRGREHGRRYGFLEGRDEAWREARAEVEKAREAGVRQGAADTGTASRRACRKKRSCIYFLDLTARIG